MMGHMARGSRSQRRFPCGSERSVDLLGAAVAGPPSYSPLDGNDLIVVYQEESSSLVSMSRE